MTLAVYPGMQALMAADFCGSSSLVATLLPGFAWMKHRQKTFCSRNSGRTKKESALTQTMVLVIPLSKNTNNPAKQNKDRSQERKLQTIHRGGGGGAEVGAADSFTGNDRVSGGEGCLLIISEEECTVTC